MCRNIHCITRMRGTTAELLAALFGQFPHPVEEEEQDHGTYLTKAAEKIETQMRASEIALSILRQPPKEGEKLVGLEAFVPGEPSKVGIVTLATYELQSGGYVIVGKDHLSQQVVQHATPNVHGLDGLTEAMRQEMVKVATKAAEQPKEEAA